MQIIKSLLLAGLTVCLVPLAGSQQKPAQPIVEMQYCGVRMGRPPLKYLSFNVTMRNPADKPQWFLFPRALYEKAPAPQSQSGVDGAEIFSVMPGHSVTVAQFMGSIRLQPESAGGVQALLLPAGAVITVRDFGISFWGDNFSSLPIQVVLADQVKIGNVPAERWAGIKLLSHRSADVSSKKISMVRSKFTPRRNELPVTIQKLGEVNIANAMATSCAENGH